MSNEARQLTIKALGHVVLYVRDAEASVAFYRDLLGLKETGRGKSGQMVFFSAGVQHHDLAVRALGCDAPRPPEGSTGLYHIAFNIGESQEELGAARAWVTNHGLTVFGETSRSFSVSDPDGHEIELYVEG
jgi:catechol-2,3-dioxygenase